MQPAPHGGNRAAIARRLGCRPDELLDLSASLAPFGPPAPLRALLLRALAGGADSPLRDYPDRAFTGLRQAIARLHGLESEQVLPGNGAAELFTWAGRDAAALGPSLLPLPGFADYRRALACWGGAWHPWPLPLAWGGAFPQPIPQPAQRGEAAVLWLTNPHNPTGQLWSRASLEPLLERFSLLIVDEAFLPLSPKGEAESLLPLVAAHPNLVVIRSLTKLYGLAGLRLAYAAGAPDRLQRWADWRDPWPLNGLAVAAGEALLADGATYRRWCSRVQGWVEREGAAMGAALAAAAGLEPLPSATNFLLVRGRDGTGEPQSLEPLRLALEGCHRILVRDCRSFPGLDGSWLRIALSDRQGRQRLLQAIAQEGAAPQRA
jgi:histidinol-phosphate/aromatic aminotransferase/cobyric acid decarboxylase-like protein